VLVAEEHGGILGKRPLDLNSISRVLKVAGFQENDGNLVSFALLKLDEKKEVTEK
jgi:hypothetical protein